MIIIINNDEKNQNCKTKVNLQQLIPNFIFNDKFILHLLSRKSSQNACCIYSGTLKLVKNSLVLSFWQDDLWLHKLTRYSSPSIKRGEEGSKRHHQPLLIEESQTQQVFITLKGLEYIKQGFWDDLWLKIFCLNALLKINFDITSLSKFHSPYLDWLVLSIPSSPVLQKSQRAYPSRFYILRPYQDCWQSQDQ